MLFDASNFHESLFKRNFCLVLFGCIPSPSYLLCLLHLLILHPHNLKDFLVRSWVVCQLRPPGSGNNHFFGATSMRQLPQPGSFFFRGFLVTDFRYKNSKSRDLPLTNTHTQRRSPNFYMEEIKFPIQQKS